MEFAILGLTIAFLVWVPSRLKTYICMAFLVYAIGYTVMSFGYKGDSLALSLLSAAAMSLGFSSFLYLGAASGVFEGYLRINSATKKVMRDEISKDEYEEKVAKAHRISDGSAVIFKD